MASGSSSEYRGTKRAVKKGTFVCERCGLSVGYYGYGRSCPFKSGLVYLEDVFIARDPFSQKPAPLIVGGCCTVCNKIVCVGQSCSVFYSKRFCLECVQSHIREFPTEIQQEVEERLKKEASHEEEEGKDHS